MLGVVSATLLLAGPRALRNYTLAEQSARIVLARQVLGEDDILRRIDRAVTAIADSVGPSVIHIDAASLGRGGSGSSGAGWVYDDRGHIVTNAHVVQGSRRIAVEFSDGVVAEGVLIGADVYTDIAVLKVDRDASALFPARRSITRLPRVGERAFAFGSPFGFKFSMSEGIVSGLGRQAPGSSIPGGYTNYIQTDAAVNPGNSGGPLVNSDGHVIGMNVAIATARSIGSNPEDSGGDSAGISFAIPLGTIEPIVEQLIEFGAVSRGYLGISFGGDIGGLDRVVTTEGVLLTGVRISAVEADGPSDAAGLRRGDVIVSVAGSPILTTESLSSLVSSGRPGQEISVRVWRDGEVMDTAVTLAPMRPQVLGQRLLWPTRLQLGVVFAGMWGDGTGPARITEVFNNMAGSLAGLRVGDTIVSVNDKAVATLNDFLIAAADNGLLTGQRVRFGVMNEQGEQRTLTMRIDR
jgi:S1-C subfamily serine protease